jgi:hypothetical protein
VIIELLVIFIQTLAYAFAVYNADRGMGLSGYQRITICYFIICTMKLRRLYEGLLMDLSDSIQRNTFRILMFHRINFMAN